MASTHATNILSSRLLLTVALLERFLLTWRAEPSSWSVRSICELCSRCASIICPFIHAMISYIFLQVYFPNHLLDKFVFYD